MGNFGVHMFVLAALPYDIRKFLQRGCDLALEMAQQRQPRIEPLEFCPVRSGK